MTVKSCHLLSLIVLFNQMSMNDNLLDSKMPDNIHFVSIIEIQPDQVFQSQNHENQNQRCCMNLF